MKEPREGQEFRIKREEEWERERDLERGREKVSAKKSLKLHELSLHEVLFLALCVKSVSILCHVSLLEFVFFRTCTCVLFFS